MYRIKLGSGEEATYDSLAALKAAVQGGVVNSYCRVYHSRTDQWLPITRHPHYHLALNGGEPEPTPRASRAPVQQPEPLVPVEPIAPEPAPSPEPPVSAAPSPAPEARAPEPPAPPQQTSTPQPSTPSTPAAPSPAPKPAAKSRTKELEWVYMPEPLARSKRASAPPPTAAPAPSSPPVAAAPTSPPAPAAAPEPPPPAPSLLTSADVQPTAPPAGPAPEPRQPRFRERAHDRWAPPPPATSYGPPAEIDLGPERPHRRRGVIAAGMVVLLGAGVFAWKPWGPRPAAADATTLAAADSVTTEAMSAALPPAAVRTPIEPGWEITPDASADTGPAMRTGFGGDGTGEPVAPPDPPTRPVGQAPTILPGRPAIRRVAGAGMPVEIAASVGGELPISHAALMRNYNAAYAAARSELAQRFAAVDFGQVLESSRLESADAVQKLRGAIAAAERAVRQYRAREAAIESAYQDTVQLIGRKLALDPVSLAAWQPRPSLRESADGAKLGDALLAQMDRIFALLLDQEGKYSVSGSAIVFADGAAAARYDNLREWLDQRLAATPPPSAVVAQIRSDLGDTRLPAGRAK